MQVLETQHRSRKTPSGLAQHEWNHWNLGAHAPPCSSMALCKPRLCGCPGTSETICRLQVESKEQGRQLFWEDNLRLTFQSQTNSAWIKVMPCFKHPPPWPTYLSIQLKVRPTQLSFWKTGHSLKLPILILKSLQPFRRWLLTCVLPPASHEALKLPSTLKRLHLSWTQLF